MKQWMLNATSDKSCTSYQMFLWSLAIDHRDAMPTLHGLAVPPVATTSLHQRSDLAMATCLLSAVEENVLFGVWLSLHGEGN